MKHDPADGVIRITKEEALDPHVDDLLKRQMSLRGERGVTRDRGCKWFYQNWFIFMVVGLLGAVAAWAIVEPFFDDMLYIQGMITKVDAMDRFPTLDGEPLPKELNFVFFGSVTINQQKVYLPRGMKVLPRDGRQHRLDFLSLNEGQNVGLYLEYEKGRDFDLAIGQFLVPNPLPQKPSLAQKTLDQLNAQSRAVGFVIFALVAGMIGLFLGAADGLVCRVPRRALVCGIVGLLVGLVGGLISNIIAGIAYSPLTALAMKQSGNGTTAWSTLGFGIQLVGRSLAWGLAGLAMGLGQGIALRSTRLLLYGLIGGVVGGLLGGLFFDPIDVILLGADKPSSHWSRLIGFAVIGASVGGLIGIVELLARDAWLRMTQGPLAGKEFLIFKDVMNIGSSPRSDIYLFNDPLVAEHHAVIRATGETCELEARQTQQPLLLNDRAVTRARLRHGDSVTIGRTIFVFQQRKS
ncbi:MAG: FHA domain-containing protein [Verrucomicrobiota bacterium]